MEKDKETNNLGKLVDDILKDNGDIISLRIKLNAIAKAREGNKLDKNTGDVERYKTILNYFLEKDEEGKYINKDRVNQNRTYLVDVMYNLTKYFPNLNAEMASKKMESLLNETQGSKSGTGTGKGAIF